MTIAEFKNKMGVESVDLFQSTKSDRLIGSGAEFVLITTEDFDLKGDKYVYSDPKARKDESGRPLYFLSNNKGTAVATV